MSNYTLAEKIVATIMDELDGRGGFDNFFAGIDTDIQVEIWDSLITKTQGQLDGEKFTAGIHLEMLEEMREGIAKQCPVCEGSGECPECDGEGDIGDDMGHLDCDDCGGSGECPRCEGKGEIYE